MTMLICLLFPCLYHIFSLNKIEKVPSFQRCSAGVQVHFGDGRTSSDAEGLGGGLWDVIC